MLHDDPEATDAQLVRDLAGSVRMSAIDATQLRDALNGARSKVERADAAALAAAAARDRVEREANALAAVLADLLDGAVLDDVVDDLPHDARRRVTAYRHQSGPMAWVAGRDQFGPLPAVPPRAAVMRDRVRVVDVDPAGENLSG